MSVLLTAWLVSFALAVIAAESEQRPPHAH